MSLDSRFFTRTTTKDHGSVRYEGYKANQARSTMVLFSTKTKTPLAALILSARDSGVLSLLTSRPKPAAADESISYFQGMLNMPSQEFTFTIANLNPRGLINFNILHTPHRVSEVDPGPAFGINQVNELHENQAYTIPADQRTKKAMILGGMTSEGGSAVSVADDEERKEKRQGVYFYLSVVPQTDCQELVDKFKEGTVWKCVSSFVRQIPKPAEPIYKGWCGMERYRSGIHPAAAAASYHPERESRGFSFGARSRGGGDGSRGGGDGSRGGGGDDDGSMEEVEELDELDEGMSLFGSRGETCPAPPRAASFALSNAAAASASVKKKSKGIRTMIGGRGDGVSGDAMEEVVPFGAATGVSAAYVAPDVGRSQAAKIQYGREVEVRTGFTGKEYAYESPSAPAVVCLSLYPEMTFLPLDDLDALLAAEIEEWVNNQGKALIEALAAIYKSETCVIDLESPADTVIIQCGHQCLNHKNTQDLKKCPMCRGSVSAFIRADGLVV
jgi:uncharacterized membrane protein YgcG